MAQAVHFSARFIYLSPTPDVQLNAKDAARALLKLPDAPEEKPTRVATLVDGAYFNNSGLGPALRTLEDARAAPDAAQRDRRNVVIHVLNAQERTCEEAPDNPACAAPGAKRLKSLQESDTMGWLTRPLQAIVAVRESHSLQRINEVKTTLAITQRMEAAAGAGAASSAAARPRPEPECSKSNCRFEPLALTFPDTPRVNRAWWCTDWLCGKDGTARQVALGWMLSPEERSVMDAQAMSLAKQLAKKYP